MPRSALEYRVNRSTKLRATARAVAVAVVAGLLGCQSPAVKQAPLVGEFGKSDPETQLEFWHRLNDLPMTSNDDAFHGLLLYFDGKDEAANYEARVASLKSSHMLPSSFSRPSSEAVDRGTVAVAIARRIRLRGGVAYSLLGPTPRYAVRELQFAGLYPPSSPNQTFSGAEFVGIIGRLEDYQRGNAADRPAAQLLPDQAQP